MINQKHPSVDDIAQAAREGARRVWREAAAENRQLPVLQDGKVVYLSARDIVAIWDAPKTHP